MIPATIFLASCVMVYSAVTARPFLTFAAWALIYWLVAGRTRNK